MTAFGALRKLTNHPAASGFARRADPHGGSRIGRAGETVTRSVAALSVASEAAALYLCRLRRLFSDRAGRGTSNQPNDREAHQQQKAAEHDKAGGDTPPIGDRTHHGRDQDRG